MKHISNLTELLRNQVIYEQNKSNKSSTVIYKTHLPSALPLVLVKTTRPPTSTSSPSGPSDRHHHSTNNNNNNNDHSHVQYKPGEFYTICMSILTAALLLFFIMWRWYRMKIDFRRALNELRESENMMQQESNANIVHGQYLNRQSSLNSQNRRLDLSVRHYQLPCTTALLPNNANNPYSKYERNPRRQQQQIIDSARFCISQLQMAQSLNNNNEQTTVNSSSSVSTDLPPSYDSIVTTSTLPSYNSIIASKPDK